ncbi:hypothetical protein [Oleiagrimonas sp.]|jgi:hypothetical protein|uniref:hypothetical protein n=1 Tax=Oleiagrimonas sp. TaxID=2010330 RepID=UPI002630E96C|nr:hypothetical protein [Oleiagrimonas sp.]MDA3914074.1 hypothetical protein [Oleiagrimonas sp.]
MSQLQAAVVDNGITGLGDHFAENPDVHYRFERVVPGWQPTFDEDLVIVPNGADHVALLQARDAIRVVLDRGGVVMNFCGCFTPWLPGTTWVHDSAHPNREMRYHVVDDPLGLMHGVDPARLSTESHGIRGWWACGGLVTRYPDQVVLADPWQRAVLVADRRSTPGLIMATASGPLVHPDPDAAEDQGPRTLYRNMLRVAARQLESGHA